ncbi:dephospho-CoA kinase [Legionella lansingensis]|uniref:Dephospho-CoA kinase n=1 Tax=Legionella lansingensis TaxID=45067 RepID=A0A0W0VTU4_9GAMM|nr:dephospho-CoA kinase [Legionella lansingensis]KTD23442.1 dephospho-CoA kinase [Legionella lansingensis]SNV50894.1 dephospho-CoA kinase [Legionella lansingensis]
MYCVGLTGNIASGKSTVAGLFRNRGITVISADDVSREVSAPCEPAYQMIRDHFGEAIITADNKLNRRALRNIIFDDPKERLWLERLLHPLIRKRIKEKLRGSKSAYSVIEIPLLNDREGYPYLNRILLVLADREHQIQRVMARDKTSREHAKAILAVQLDDSKRKEIADDIIFNNGTLSELEEKIENLHQQYLQFASQAQ